MHEEENMKNITNSAANKDMMSKILTNGNTIF